jgi:hypothetical protein
MWDFLMHAPRILRAMSNLVYFNHKNSNLDNRISPKNRFIYSFIYSFITSIQIKSILKYESLHFAN